MASSILASRVPLPRAASGLSLPQLHLGVYMMSGREAYSAITSALSAGYRGVDSAQMYHNERECGAAIRDFLADPSLNAAGLRREDLHYTTKLASNSDDYNTVRRSIQHSVDIAGLGYVDLMLLHSPYGGQRARLASWKALEDAVAEGQVRAAGVSNYGQRHLEELLDSADVRLKPSVNQIEVHPFNTREELTAFCKSQDIVVEAYAPLARAMRMRDRTLAGVAKKHGVSPAQVLVRWSLQRGYVPLPKSTKKGRIVENASVDGFEIGDDDMAALNGLDEELVTDWDPLDAP